VTYNGRQNSVIILIRFKTITTNEWGGSLVVSTNPLMTYNLLPVMTKLLNVSDQANRHVEQFFCRVERCSGHGLNAVIMLYCNGEITVVGMF